MNFGTFLDPVALALVGGGTLVSAILRTPAADLGRALAALRTLPRRRFSADPLLEQITSLGRIARRHGALALDKSVIADRDVAAAIADIVDGRSADAVGDQLRQLRLARIERHCAAADVWAGMAEAAPAMGMVGTLVGLVAMFVQMTDPQAIGGAMAVALLATLACLPVLVGLGAVFGQVPFLRISAVYWPVPVLIFGYALALRHRAPATARGLAAGAAILCLSLTFRSLDAGLCVRWPLGTHWLWHILNAVMLGWMIEVYRRHMLAGQGRGR